MFYKLSKQSIDFLQKKSLLFQILPKYYGSLSSKKQSGIGVAAEMENLKSIDDIPGPRIWPLIGSLLSIKGFGGNLDILDYNEFSNQLYAKYGDIVRIKIFDRDQVLLFDPEYVKKFYQIDGDIPKRPDATPWSAYFKMRGIPNTLVSSQGNEWRKLRSASNPILARPKTVQYFLPSQNKIGNDFMGIIDEKVGNEKTIVLTEFQENLKLLGLEFISVVAFDQPLNCIDERNRTDDIKKLIKATDDFMIYTGILNYSLPIYHYYPTQTWKKFVAAADVLFNTVRHYVKKSYEDLMKQSEESRQDLGSKTILQQYLLTMKKQNLSLDHVIALTSDFLLAGIDTTSIALHFLIYELGKNQEIQQTLYEEIIANCENNDDFSEEKLNNMPFLKAVLKEALRLHPIAPVNARILKEDMVLSNYKIPKGTWMFAPSKFLSTSDKYFVDGNTFNPKRWIKGNKENENLNPYASLPFGFGARMCIGRRVAEQEIYLIITKFIKRYQIEYIGKPMKYKIRFTAAPEHPLNIRITKRV